jgi:glycerol-3-phosphate acyltransferase PlsY
MIYDYTQNLFDPQHPDFALFNDVHFWWAVALAYLLGSIPFAVIISKFAGIGDIRNYGSGNPGATNMTKVAGKKWGAITLLLDLGKGVLAVLLTHSIFDYAAAGALFVVIGHCFSVFLKFKGGKGVATTLGVLLTLYYPAGLVFIALWLVTFLAFRISSVSALVAINVLMFVSYYMWYGNLFYLLTFLSILVTARHNSNIKRLLEGKEK